MSAVETETFPGAPGGSNLAIPQAELPDDQCYILQDAFVHLPTYTRRRGPVQKVSGSPDTAYYPLAVVTTFDPAGVSHIGVLHGYDSSHTQFSVLTQARTGWALNYDLSITPDAYPPVVATSPAPGGVMIGYSGKYDAVTAANQGIIYWGGADKADYTNTAVTIQREHTDMTCSSGFSANVASGMWAFSSTLLIGQVRTVNSDTSITLVGGSVKTVTAGSVTFKSIRGPANTPHVMTGEITSANNTDKVQGGATKFKKQLATGSVWDVFRWWDFNYDGTVSSIASDFALTYATTSAHDNFEEEFVAIKTTGTYGYTFSGNGNYGWIPASYAGRQWYANLGSKRENTYRLWFSNPKNAEALDLTTDGDWIDVKSSEGDHKPIRGLASTHNSLLIFKEDETFALFGTDPETFTLQRIHDDGLWSPMTIQPYNEGIIWAGKRGVYFFDGSSISKLIEDKMGPQWRQGLLAKNPNTSHMYSMLDNHHYFLNFTWASPVVLTRNTTTETPNTWTLVINLDTGAISFMSNLYLRGAANLPGDIANRAFYAVPTSTTTVGKVCDASELFNSTGADVVTCVGATAGPAFYMESKKFPTGDPAVIKKFRELLIHYQSNGTTMKVDSVLGLNSTGAVETVTLADLSGLWGAKRIQFGHISQHYSFRLYQNSSSLTSFYLGPYQVRYKRLRVGRV